MEAAASPLPSEDTTPPVTKMYFADISASENFVVLIGRACGARLTFAGIGGGGNGVAEDRFEVRGSRVRRWQLAEDRRAGV